MVNPYLDSNTTLMEASSDQELGKQTRELNNAKQTANKMIEPIAKQAFDAGGLAGRQAIEGANQSRSDLINMIYGGTPDEAAEATRFGLSTGLLDEQLLNEVVGARQRNEQPTTSSSALLRRQ